MSGIQTKPEPYCPDCGAKMTLRRPRPTSTTQFAPFWGCSQYPVCKGTRKIGSDGKPVLDEGPLTAADLEEYDF